MVFLGALLSGCNASKHLELPGTSWKAETDNVHWDFGEEDLIIKETGYYKIDETQGSLPHRRNGSF